jgi:hypothetical protein
MPVGDDAEAVGFDDALMLEVAHVPDTVPELASNRGVGLVRPVVEIVPPQAAVLPLIAFCGTIPANVGLTPGDESCVAPRGIPAGATGAPGPMPSGVVTPSGDGVPTGDGATCASAGCAIASAATVARIERCFIGVSVSGSAQSAEASLVTGRGLAGDLAECGGE